MIYDKVHTKLFTNLMMQLPGKVTMQKLECPHKPPDTMQSLRSVTAQTDDVFPPDVSRSTHRQENPSEIESQVAPKTFSGSLDDLDIPYIDEDEDQSWAQHKL